MTRPKNPIWRIKVENKMISKLSRIRRLPECDAGNFSQLCQFNNTKDSAATRPKKTHVALPGT
jgi:hypothetical protein